MNRIKVLKIIKTLDILGGAERMMYLFIKLLDKRRFDLSICSLCKFALEKQQYLRNCNIDVYFLKNKKKIDFAFYHQLYSIMNRVQPHIVHSHNFYPNKYSRIVGCVFPHVRKVIHEHGTVLTKSKKQRYYDKYLKKCTDRVVVVSKSVAESLINNIGFSRSMIEILPNGIDLKEYDKSKIDRNNIRKFFGLDTDTIVIGMVARLHKHKDHDTLLCAISQLVKTRRNIKLLLVGDGPCRKTIEKQVHTLGIEKHVTFLGHRTDIPKITAAFDIAVLSSKTEGFGISILEAMALEIPVIASSIEGIKEIVNHGHNGLLFPCGDARTLHELFNVLINNKELYKSIAINGKTTVEKRFNIETTVRRLETLYESLV
jgi:glycosyltransferase involved in cell wall biosynthesis